MPREKGRRREVRRMLAQRSVQLLARYRQGQPIEVASCRLARALAPHRVESVTTVPVATQLGLAL